VASFFRQCQRQFEIQALFSVSLATRLEASPTWRCGGVQRAVGILPTGPSIARQKAATPNH
jgi:hypothetical protein